MTNATPNAPSANDDINKMIQADRWDAMSVTFSVPTNADQYGDYQYGKFDDDGVWMPADETAGFVAPSAAFTEAVRDAMDMIESYTNLDLIELVVNPGDAVIRAGITFQPKPWMDGGRAYAVGPKDESDPLYHVAGDAWFPPNDIVEFGNTEYTTVLHEMGHTVGLSDVNRVGSGVNMLSPEYQSPEFSLMSYMGFQGATGEGWSMSFNHGPQSFMMMDIVGLQYMYGADFTTNGGDTLYTFDSLTGEMFINGAGQGTPAQNILFRTIWDGNGIDTYNFASYGADRDLNIDLAPGKWTDVDRDSHHQAANLGGGPNAGYAGGQVYNALQYEGDERSLIENAIGGAGDDSIRGNLADNVLTGGAGNDSLYGLEGDDVLIQGAGGGYLSGGSGNDTMHAGDGAELFIGSSGRDRVSYAASNAMVIANLGTGTGALGFAQGDTYSGVEDLIGSTFNDLLFGNNANNYLRGDGGDDRLSGAAGIDTLIGGNGDDTLIGGEGADRLFGNEGTDTASFGSAVTLNFVTGIHTEEAAGDQYSSIERFEGSQSADTMIGSWHSDWFSGRGGDDQLDGGSGNDTLIGGAGFDTLNGGSGTDLVDYSGEAAAVNVNLAFGFAVGTSVDGDGLSSIEYVSGSALNDTLVGNDGANRLWGNDGNDSINGGAGADSVYGGDGNDTVVGGAGDVLMGGDGFDVLRFYGAPVLVNLASGLHSHAQIIAQFERIEGTTGGDILVASNAAMALAGQDGDDTLTGGGGGDTLQGGDGRDSLEGLGGNDLLRGGAGADTITGGSGADVVRWETGDVGTDLIVGFDLSQDRFSFGEGFLASPVLGGGELVDMLEVVTLLGSTVLRGFTAEAGWQNLARLEGVSTRALDAMIEDGSILAPVSGLTDGLFA